METFGMMIGAGVISLAVIVPSCFIIYAGIKLLKRK